MGSACPGSGTRSSQEPRRRKNGRDADENRERCQNAHTRERSGERREKDGRKTGERREKDGRMRKEQGSKRAREHVQDFVNERPWDCRVRARARDRMKEKLRERECFVSIKEERVREWSEWEILEWRASGNLRSCDRYKRNIFLFPGIYLNA